MRMLHAVPVVVCDLPRALTVRLLEQRHTAQWREMAGCALWMPLPAGKVLPPAPQVGFASGRGPSDLSKS